MKIPTKKILRWIFSLAVPLSAILILSACNSPPTANGNENLNETRPEIMIPIVGSDVDAGTEPESQPEDTAFPEVQQEPQDPVVDEVPQADPYPAAETELPPTEVPTEAPKPTSRGDALEATNPSTVSLASGKLQLVEFFAFW
jgi:hypothetical protein